MPRQLESFTEERLVPAKPSPEPLLEAGIFKPAAAGQVVTFNTGGKVAVDPVSKKLVPYVDGANDSTGKLYGLTEWPVTVDDQGRCHTGIYTAAQLGDSRIGESQTSPIFTGGVFDRRDCDNLTDAALASGGWAIRQDGFIQKGA